LLVKTAFGSLTLVLLSRAAASLAKIKHRNNHEAD